MNISFYATTVGVMIHEQRYLLAKDTSVDGLKGENINGEAISVDEVEILLINRNPRMKIILLDCGFEYLDEKSKPPQSKVRFPSAPNLFRLHPALGQMAYGNRHGSFITDALLTSL